MKFVSTTAIAFWALLLFCWPLPSQEHGGPKQNDLLGAVLPNLSLRDAAGNTLTPDSLVSGKPSLLLLLPATETEADCKARQSLADRLSGGLNALEVSVIPVLPKAAQQGRNTCSADAKVYFRGDPPQRSIRLDGLGGLFLDGDQTVRRVFPYEDGARGAELIIEDVGLWFDGKEWFKSQCARCHGEDTRTPSPWPGSETGTRRKKSSS